jgi:hypothetical protein
MELAEKVVKTILAAVMDPLTIGAILNRKACYIVIIVPGMTTEGCMYPDYPITPHVLYEHSEGDTASSNHEYDEIARCKALQLWHGRNDDRTDCIPHLLFNGDTPYYGGVKRGDIVVTCSGFKPWLDKMVSGMICDMLIGLAYQAWMTSNEKLEGRDFLT